MRIVWRSMIVIASIVLIIAAVPVGFVVDFNVIGCCGASDPGQPKDSLPYIAGIGSGVLGVGGLALFYKTRRK